MSRRPIAFTAEDEATVTRRHRAGESAEAIAASYGCSSGPVIRILKRHEVYTPRPWTGGPRHNFSDEQTAEIVRRYEGGEGATSIAGDYACTKVTIQCVLRNAGVYEGRKRLRAFDANQEQEVLRRYAAGESARSIGLSFGFSSTPVMNVLKAHGRYKARDFDGFTRDQEVDMVTRYRAGESVESIRRAYGCSRSPIETVLKRHNAYTPQKTHGFTAEERSEIVALYRDGVRPSEISRTFNCSQGAVAMLLQRLGEWRPPTSFERIGSRFTMDQKREMVDLYESGSSIYKIGKAFGSTPQSVWRILQAAGVEFRDKAWRGGRVKASNGYIAVAAEPGDEIASAMATVIGYVLEHRLVMARSLGRPLAKNETVHHINGDKTDNSLENLQLRMGAHGNGIRLGCLDCGSHNVKPLPLH